VKNCCELLENCAFFKRFEGTTEPIKFGWMRLYCQSWEKSGWCERKIHFEETGSAPPHNMTPTGFIIPDDAGRQGRTMIEKDQ